MTWIVELKRYLAGVLSIVVLEYLRLLGNDNGARLPDIFCCSEEIAGLWCFLGRCFGRYCLLISSILKLSMAVTYCRRTGRELLVSRSTALYQKASFQQSNL